MYLKKKQRKIKENLYLKQQKTFDKEKKSKMINKKKSKQKINKKSFMN